MIYTPDAYHDKSFKTTNKVSCQQIRNSLREDQTQNVCEGEGNIFRCSKQLSHKLTSQEVFINIEPRRKNYGTSSAASANLSSGSTYGTGGKTLLHFVRATGGPLEALLELYDRLEPLANIHLVLVLVIVGILPLV